MAEEYAVPKRVTVIKKEFLADRIIECTFQYDGELVLSPGQYIFFQIDDVRRPFTAIADARRNVIKIVIKLIEGTLTSIFFENLKIGNALVVEIPKTDNMYRISHSTVFVATGTGVIPFYEIARHALEAGNQNDIRIVFGVRAKDDLFYVNEIKELEDRYSNCRVVFALSEPHDLWGGFRGRVDDYILQNFDEMSDSNFYICGKEETISSISALLSRLGIESDRQHRIE